MLPCYINLRCIPETLKKWDREPLMSSELSRLNGSAFRVPYGEDGEVMKLELIAGQYRTRHCKI